ncbi:hypothetical protein JCGZ_13650 [Jatropha curcas]|uniref:Uncharacterized protein n=1 Tax=Jatropha curcas TaxID=180498 RepID=A0A067KMM5_JATCU|nr:hypothetical protein JCGZ_13650 [Jatropha curcas]
MEIQPKVCSYYLGGISVSAAVERPVIGSDRELLVHIPPLSEFDPFVKAEEPDRGQGGAPAQCDKRVRRGFDFEAPNTTIPISRSTSQVLPSLSFWSAKASQHRACWRPILCLSLLDYNEVCQLYEAARLKLAIARLSDEHVSVISVVPREGQGAGCRPVIVEETEESGSDDSEETASYIS